MKVTLAAVVPALIALALAAPAAANHSAPTNLRVTGKTHNSVSLDWNDHKAYGPRSVNDDYHVRVFNSAGTLQRTVEKDPDPRDGLNESSTIVVTDLSPSTTYQFDVSAQAAGGHLSRFSVRRSATTDAPPCALSPPTNIRTTSKTASAITIAWTKNCTATGYKTFRARASGGGDTYVEVGDVATYTYTGLQPNTTYRLNVAAMRGRDPVQWGAEYQDTTSATAPSTPMVLGTMVNRAGGGPSYTSVNPNAGTKLFREEEGWSRTLADVTREARASGFDVLPVVNTLSTARSYAQEFRPRWMEIDNEVYYDTTPQEYRDRVCSIHSAVKAISPQTTIIISGVSPDQDPNVGSWLPNFKALGIERCMDSVAIHPYRLASKPADWSYNHDAVAYARNQFPTKSVSVTEFGWPTSHGGGGPGYTPVVTEAQQASFMSRVADELAALGYVDVAILYRWNQAGNPGTIEGHFHVDGKPAASVFRQEALQYPL